MANPGGSGQSEELRDYGDYLRDSLRQDELSHQEPPHGEQLVPAPADGEREVLQRIRDLSSGPPAASVGGGDSSGRSGNTSRSLTPQRRSAEDLHGLPSEGEYSPSRSTRRRLSRKQIRPLAFSAQSLASASDAGATHVQLSCSYELFSPGVARETDAR